MGLCDCRQGRPTTLSHVLSMDSDFCGHLTCSWHKPVSNSKPLVGSSTLAGWVPSPIHETWLRGDSTHQLSPCRDPKVSPQGSTPRLFTLIPHPAAPRHKGGLAQGMRLTPKFPKKQYILFSNYTPRWAINGE